MKAVEIYSGEPDAFSAQVGIGPSEDLTPKSIGSLKRIEPTLDTLQATATPTFCRIQY